MRLGRPVIKSEAVAFMNSHKQTGLKKLLNPFLPNVPFLLRSTRLDVFCKKGVLKNFVKFTGKHLYQSLFFNKVAGLKPVKGLKFQRTLFFIEHLWCLLLFIPLNTSENLWISDVFGRDQKKTLRRKGLSKIRSLQFS